MAHFLMLCTLTGAFVSSVFPSNTECGIESCQNASFSAGPWRPVEEVLLDPLSLLYSKDSNPEPPPPTQPRHKTRSTGPFTNGQKRKNVQVIVAPTFYYFLTGLKATYYNQPTVYSLLYQRLENLPLYQIERNIKNIIQEKTILGVR